MLVQRKTIYSLQAGRALAAVAVVIHHAALAAHDFGGSLEYTKIFDLGYLGVDFFFVLSGFIIYHSTVGGPKSAVDYAKSRVRRIYFPYFPIGISIAMFYMLLPGTSLSVRDWSWLTTLTLIPIGAPALSVAWTLQHEIMFYFMFGVAFFSGHLFLCIFLWCSVIVCSALIGAPDLIPLRPINLEFVFGIGAAVLAQRGRWHVAMVPAALICFTLWVLLGYHRGLSVLVGLGFALLVPVLVAAERGGWLRIPSTFVLLGAASYSIYLAHGLAISVVVRMLHGPWKMMIGAILAGISSGLIYYLAIERPLLSFAQSKIKLNQLKERLKTGAEQEL